MSSPDSLRAALGAVEQIVERGGEPDDVLRDVVGTLHGVYPYAAIAFVEEEELAGGPSAGAPQEPLTAVDVTFRDVKVAELQVAGASDDDAPALERVATLISPHCLVGWDTGGEPWAS